MITLATIVGAVWMIAVAFGLIVVLGCKLLDRLDRIRYRNHHIVEAAERSKIAGRLFQDASWFSEHPPTQRLLTRIAEDMTSHGWSDVADLRDKWRFDIGQFKMRNK